MRKIWGFNIENFGTGEVLKTENLTENVSEFCVGGHAMEGVRCPPSLDTMQTPIHSLLQFFKNLTNVTVLNPQYY